MSTGFRTFLRDARTKPLSRKGALVAFYGAFAVVAGFALLVELFVGGKFEMQAAGAFAFFVCFSTSIALRGGLWKEQTQTAADRRV